MRLDTLQVVLDTSAGANSAHIVVTGVDKANLNALRKAGWPNGKWTQLLAVAVSGVDSIPMAGRYAVSDTAIEFHPLFSFDLGRPYRVRLDPANLPHRRGEAPLSLVVERPRIKVKPSTTVARVLPTETTVPENQLRFYIEFSAPMSRQPGVDFVHLIGDDGREVTHAFLPLDADFWNPDHTRFTVFLDPGRVKRGILPNEQMGRALRAGHAYALVVDTAWHDANGLPLAKPHRAEFYAGPAITEPITLAVWTVRPPRAGTRDPLVVKFPRPLDHGLLQRAIGVSARDGASVQGDITIGPGEREWRLAPHTPWRTGDYQLVVLSILEDVAGNRVGHAFEVDMFQRADSTSAPERYTIPFKIQ